MSGRAHYSEPFQGKDGLWYFHLQSGNGEVVSQSEGYETEAGAERGIEDAKRVARGADVPPEEA
jgi:uncharacterized protein YegP (UPF0339 family)